MTPGFRWSLATPLLVLVGLFGMHGLGEHSAAHADAAHADARHPGMAMPAQATMFDGPVLASASSDDMSGMAVGLCVAILLGGLVAWLALGNTRRRTPWSLPRQALMPPPVPRSRAPDPPSPLLLSVCRC